MEARKLEYTAIHILLGLDNKGVEKIYILYIYVV